MTIINGDKGGDYEDNKYEADVTVVTAMVGLIAGVLNEQTYSNDRPLTLDLEKPTPAFWHLYDELDAKTRMSLEVLYEQLFNPFKLSKEKLTISDDAKNTEKNIHPTLIKEICDTLTAINDSPDLKTVAMIMDEHAKSIVTGQFHLAGIGQNKWWNSPTPSDRCMTEKVKSMRIWNLMRQNESYANEVQDHAIAVECVNTILRADKNYAYVHDGSSAAAGANEFILGGAEVRHTSDGKRRDSQLPIDIDYNDKKQIVKRVREKILDYNNNKENKKRPTSAYFYEGRGAYTGVVYDTTEKEVCYVTPTRRVYDQTQRHWHPDTRIKYWGAIGFSAKTKDDQAKIILKKQQDDYLINPYENMNPAYLDESQQGLPVGYVHGMCNAMAHVEDTAQKKETTKITLEMATGAQTTKIASCFGCTTYMYAGGRAPSSIHLGRSESWVPPYPYKESGGYVNADDYDNEDVDKMKEAKYDHWVECMDTWLNSGIEKITKYIKQSTVGGIDGWEKLEETLRSLEKKLTNNNKIGAAIFLNSLTFHDKESNRIINVLKPIYDDLQTQTDNITSITSGDREKEEKEKEAKSINKDRIEKNPLTARK